MVSRRLFWGICFIAFAATFQTAAGENFPLIIKGTVTMPDGSPPPFSVGIERICSDGYGDAPGPITNNKGEYLWRMDVDPMRTRACRIRATHAGYTSTSIDISALHAYIDKTVTLDPIVIAHKAADPYLIVASKNDVPSRAWSGWKAAMDAMDARDYSEARRQFAASVEAAPKFALGWHALGVISEFQNMQKEARDAYEKAVASDTQLLPAHVTLVRLCIKTKDWAGAIKASDVLIKVDKKRKWPEVHLHRAVALYGMNDLDTAAASVQEAIRMDPYHSNPRTEYVLGRILEAKGDLSGAREHISKYLELDKKAPDFERIRKRLQNLGDPKATETEGALPELEYL